MGKPKALYTNSGVLSLTGNVAAAGLGLIAFFLLARLLDPAAFGTWVLYLTFVGLAEMVLAGLIRMALIRNLFEAEKPVIGTAWIVALCITAILAFLLMAVGWALPYWVAESNLTIVVDWFPIFLFVSLPAHFTFWIQQARSRFDRILWSRLLRVLPYTLFLAWAFIQDYVPSLNELAIIHLASFGLASAVGIVANWCHVAYMRHAERAWVRPLLDFGKYSLGTTLGTNLLKSSDTLIINWMLGPTAVALYNVPAKVIEVIEIPVRSLVATALPQLARLHSEQNGSEEAIAHLFQRIVGFLTWMLIPVLVVCFIWAEPLVTWIGGEAYASSALILRIFAVYGLFLPLDRFLGITLDSINKPRHNFIKVIRMLLVNVVADVIVIEVFGEVWPAAVVTVLTVLVGIGSGLRFLQRDIPVHLNSILSDGWKYVRQTHQRLTKGGYSDG